MAIDPVSATGSATGASAPVENPGAVLDRDAFLKLLVAQLKYQDPTNPADTSQMLTQSAQLTMVDRLNDIAENLTAKTAVDRLDLGGSLVGRHVTFLDTDGTLRSERVDAVRFDGTDTYVSAGGATIHHDAVLAVLAPTTV